MNLAGQKKKRKIKLQQKKKWFSISKGFFSHNGQGLAHAGEFDNLFSMNSQTCAKLTVICSVPR
jgi:hypothetical protein